VLVMGWKDWPTRESKGAFDELDFLNALIQTRGIGHTPVVVAVVQTGDCATKT